MTSRCRSAPLAGSTEITAAETPSTHVGGQRPPPGTDLHLLDNPIRDYPWGSRTALAQLLGRPAPGHPQAELWVGAHGAAPSMIAGRGRSLADVIAEEPGRWLGPASRLAQGELPFLLKVLAVAAPLSLQVHPDRRRAAAGHAAELAAGVPPGERTFRDPHGKPELVCAVSDFDALCGLRPVGELVALLSELALPWTTTQVARLRAVRRPGAPGYGEESAAAVRALLGALLRPPDPALLTTALRSLPAGERFDIARDLAAAFPSDPGVLVAPLLNRVRLAPGEALYLPPGQLHAYLGGVGIELMCCSDNVLRGGLTAKTVDVPALLEAVDTAPDAPQRVRMTPRGAWRCYRPPVPDFELGLAQVDASGLVSAVRGPQLLLCLQGGLEVDEDGVTVPVDAGQAVFVPDGVTPRVSGAGTVVRASTAQA